MIADRLYDKVAATILFGMVCTWSLVWDFFDHTGNFMRAGRLKFFLLAAVLLLALRFAKTWHWSMGLLFLYIGGRYVFEGLPSYGLVEMTVIPTTLLLIPEMNSRISANAFEIATLIASCIHSVVGILNQFRIFPFLAVTNQYNSRPIIGLLGQHTILAPFLVFGFAIALHRLIESRGRAQAIYFGAACLNLIVIILCGSTMGYISLLSLIPVFMLFYSGVESATASLVAGLALAVLANQLFPNLSGFSGRLEPWGDAWSLIKEHPWLGYGVGFWSVTAVKIGELRSYPVPWIQLHNEYLQGLFEVGGIGMAMVLVFIGRITKCICAFHLLRASVLRSARGIKNMDLLPYFAGMVLFGTNMVGNFTLHVAPHGMIFAYCAFKILEEYRVRITCAIH